MGCLKNIIRAIILVLAVIGFLSIGGKEFVTGMFSKWINPPQETILERLGAEAYCSGFFKKDNYY